MKPIAGRPVGVCCGCFSMETTQTELGTYYCAPCLASAVDFAARVRGYRRSIKLGLSPLVANANA